MVKQQSFKVKLLEEKKDYAKFLIGPLDQGYGQTIGNSLRRCLLSSIPGASVTKVKIEGVKHQFSTLPGIKEDIVELILNIKQICFIYKGSKEIKLSLEANGPKEIKAGDIKTPAEISIINKDLKLAKLADKKANLNLALWVQSGYGYSPSEERKSDILGVMSVDALFSPITRVNYKVEATRVGRRTDLDSLILEIWTNGAIKPKKALDTASEILVGFLKQIYNPVYEKPEVPKETKEENNEDLKLTVEELNLPTRIANALRKGGYPTIKALVEAERQSLNNVKNLGAKSIEIVDEKLKEKGFSLK